MTSYAIGWGTAANVQAHNGSITGTRSELKRSGAFGYAVVTNTRENNSDLFTVGETIIGAPITWPSVDFFDAP